MFDTCRQYRGGSGRPLRCEQRTRPASGQSQFHSAEGWWCAAEKCTVANRQNSFVECDAASQCFHESWENDQSTDVTIPNWEGTNTTLLFHLPSDQAQRDELRQKLTPAPSCATAFIARHRSQQSHSTDLIFPRIIFARNRHAGNHQTPDKLKTLDTTKENPRGARFLFLWHLQRPRSLQALPTTHRTKHVEMAFETLPKSNAARVFAR